MRRSVMQQGTGTLLVSLPVAWTKTNGVKKGTELTIVERGETLSISAQNEKPLRAATIDISALHAHKKKGNQNQRGALLRLISAQYQAGLDEITLTFNEPELLLLIQDALRDEELSDLEIVEQSAKRVVIQDIGSVREERLDAIIKRVCYLLLQMGEESGAALREQNYAALQSLRYLEQANNRFTTYARRVLAKRARTDGEPFLMTTLFTLELLADQYKYCFDALVGSKEKLREETLQIWENAARLLRLYVELFTSASLEILAKMGETRTELVAQANTLLLQSRGANTLVAHYALIIAQLTYELAETALAHHALKRTG